MTDPIVLPLWAVILFFVFLAAMVAYQTAINTQLGAIISAVFGPTRADAARWQHILSEGAHLTVDEDGCVIMVVPFDEQDALRKDPQYADLMGLLDATMLQGEPLERFIDQRRAEPEEVVGDLLPGMPA